MKNDYLQLHEAYLKHAIMDDDGRLHDEKSGRFIEKDKADLARAIKEAEDAKQAAEKAKKEAEESKKQSENQKKSEENKQQTSQNQNVKSLESELQKQLNETSKSFINIANNLPKGEQKKVYGKYKNLSDDELSSMIKRLQLERQYSDLKGDTETIKSGSDKAREFFQTTGSLLAIASTALGIVLTIKNLTKD